MLGPGWPAGCPSCSFLSDHIEGARPASGTSRCDDHCLEAPLAEIQAYKTRMGWQFPWASSFESDFNFDFHVSFSPEQLASRKVVYNFTEMPAPSSLTELPGLSAFYKDEAGDVFRTYSTYARGLEELAGTLMLLDRAPRGRNEKRPMDFVRRHDEYPAETKTGE